MRRAVPEHPRTEVNAAARLLFARRSDLSKTRNLGQASVREGLESTLWDGIAGYLVLASANSSDK